MINSVYNRFIRYFRGREFCPFFNRGWETNGKFKNEMKVQFERKMKLIVKAYEDLFSLTKFYEAQDRIIEAQTDLEVAQENRRKVQEEVFTIQKKYQEMQDILQKTSIGDDNYITLITQNRELLKEQKRLKDVFSLYDQTERQKLTALALAVNSSIDCERSYREKNKYVSAIAGIIGAVLGLIVAQLHRKDYKLLYDKIVCTERILKEFLSSRVDVSSEAIDESLSTDKHLKNMLYNINKSLLSLLNDRITTSSTSNQNPDELLCELERKFELQLKNYAYASMGSSVTLIGSCTILFSLLIFYITRNS